MVRDDASAVQQVQEGNAEAFGWLMDSHLARVRALVALRVPRAHLIEEIVHDTFVFAYLNIHKFRRGASLSSWLLSIALNLIRAELLRQARERANQAKYVRLCRPKPGPSIASPAEEKKLDMAGLGDLGVGGENLLLLRYALGYGAGEIAERVGRSPGWVRSALFRLRQEIRRRVAPPVGT